jgi:hypothetical protein
MRLENFLKRARCQIFNAQESLKGLDYNHLAIWKAVAIGACVQEPWRGRHFWDGNFAAVTGYRPGRRGLLGRVRFHSGEISLRQFVMSRIGRAGFPNRRDSPPINCASNASSAVATSTDVSIAVMDMAGVGAGDGGAVTVGGSPISDCIVPEWTHSESAGFSELARHIIMNYHPFIKRDGAPSRFQLELL